MSLGTRIKEYRKENHLTQEQLADKLMVSRQAVSKWESDSSEPDIKTLIALSHIFHISVEELICDEMMDFHQEINLVEEDKVIQKQDEILKVHRKSHRLLMFLVSFVIVFLFVFVICPLSVEIANHLEYRNHQEIDSSIRFIEKQIKEENGLVKSVYFEPEIISYVHQQVNWKGEVWFNDVDIKDCTLMIYYEDNTTEEIPITQITDNHYQFEKIILAKNIQELVFQTDTQKQELKQIYCPIEDYMYANEFGVYVSEESSHPFQLEFMVTNSIIEFDVCIQLKESEQALQEKNENYLVGITNIRVSIYKNDVLIGYQEFKDLMELDGGMKVGEIYDERVQYHIMIDYDIPLRHNNHFEIYMQYGMNSTS